MSLPVTRKSGIIAVIVSAAILATLFVPFQKAIGDSINNFTMTQLDLMTAESPSKSIFSLTVNALDISEGPIQGVWTTIQSSNGTVLESGYTPFTFSVDSSSAEYNVIVADFDGKTFQYWQDTGSRDRTRTVNVQLTGQNAILTAVYDTGYSLRGFTPLTYNNTKEQQPDLTLQAATTDGIVASGLYMIIDPEHPTDTSMAGTMTYRVYASDYQDKVFDHWEDTESADRIRTLTIEEDTTITAIYRTGGGEKEEECNPDLSGPTMSMDPLEGQIITEDTYEIFGAADGSGNCGVENVSLRILNSDDMEEDIVDYQSASDVSAPEGPTWSEWTYQYTFPTNGNYVIEVKVIDLSGNFKVFAVPISVNFESPAEEPPIADTSRPIITIISPSDGAVVNGPSSGVIVDLTGTASDDLGELRNVWVRVDGGAYRAVTPGAPNDWSEWTHSVTLNTEGIHEITAKAIDIAENPQWHTINVTLSFAPP